MVLARKSLFLPETKPNKLYVSNAICWLRNMLLPRKRWIVHLDLDSFPILIEGILQVVVGAPRFHGRSIPQVQLVHIDHPKPFTDQGGLTIQIGRVVVILIVDNLNDVIPKIQPIHSIGHFCAVESLVDTARKILTVVGLEIYDEIPRRPEAGDMQV